LPTAHWLWTDCADTTRFLVRTLSLTQHPANDVIPQDVALARPGPATQPDGRSIASALLPIMAVVFVGFLITGMAMPVLPLHVHQRLGLGTFVVGLVAGAQFAASLVSRFWSGRYADARGGKQAMMVGILMAAAAGALYLASLRFADAPSLSVTILIVGRAMLGWAESCMITGALTWGLALGGRGHSGRVIAWVGTALWGAFAAGAPLGTLLYDRVGFVGIALTTMLLPLVTLALVVRQQAIPPTPHAAPAFAHVIGAVALPGIALALGSVGFGAITTFSTLYFAERTWSGAWLVFTVLCGVFILGRIAFGHLPDRLGGARVALVCVVIQAVGLAAIWLAPSAAVVFAGAAITGAGYSLVFPGFGVEAVRRAPPESRGMAMGIYSAYLDLALGIANPLLGYVAGHQGLRAVFLVSALLVAGASVVATRMLAGR